MPVVKLLFYTISKLRTSQNQDISQLNTSIKGGGVKRKEIQFSYIDSLTLMKHAFVKYPCVCGSFLRRTSFFGNSVSKTYAGQ